MAGIKRFEEIQAWQKAREVTREIYQLCRANASKFFQNRWYCYTLALTQSENRFSDSTLPSFRLEESSFCGENGGGESKPANLLGI